ncbi:MAG: hypothetical protein ABFC77_05765 [Thermoguttaceae bacterium]
MTSETKPRPIEWHRKPQGFRKQQPCPICGFAGDDEHRVVAFSERSAAKWRVRRIRPNGLYYTKPIKGLPSGPAPIAAPTPQVARQMGELAAMLAQGKSRRDAAEIMGLSRGALRYWTTHWAAYWQMLLAFARETARASFDPEADREAVRHFLERGETAVFVKNTAFDFCTF